MASPGMKKRARQEEDDGFALVNAKSEQASLGGIRFQAEEQQVPPALLQQKDSAGAGPSAVLTVGQALVELRKLKFPAALPEAPDHIRSLVISVFGYGVDPDEVPVAKLLTRSQVNFFLGDTVSERGLQKGLGVVKCQLRANSVLAMVKLPCVQKALGDDGAELQEALAALNKDIKESVERMLTAAQGLAEQALATAAGGTGAPAALGKKLFACDTLMDAREALAPTGCSLPDVITGSAQVLSGFQNHISRRRDWHKYQEELRYAWWHLSRWALRLHALELEEQMGGAGNQSMEGKASSSFRGCLGYRKEWPYNLAGQLALKAVARTLGHLQELSPCSSEDRQQFAAAVRTHSTKLQELLVQEGGNKRPPADRELGSPAPCAGGAATASAPGSKETVSPYTMSVDTNAIAAGLGAQALSEAIEIPDCDEASRHLLARVLAAVAEGGDGGSESTGTRLLHVYNLQEVPVCDGTQVDLAKISAEAMRVLVCMHETEVVREDCGVGPPGATNILARTLEAMSTWDLQRQKWQAWSQEDKEERSLVCPKKHFADAERKTHQLLLIVQAQTSTIWHRAAVSLETMRKHAATTAAAASSSNDAEARGRSAVVTSLFQQQLAILQLRLATALHRLETAPASAKGISSSAAAVPAATHAARLSGQLAASEEPSLAQKAHAAPAGHPDSGGDEGWAVRRSGPAGPGAASTAASAGNTQLHPPNLLGQAAAAGATRPAGTAAKPATAARPLARKAEVAAAAPLPPGAAAAGASGAKQQAGGSSRAANWNAAFKAIIGTWPTAVELDEVLEGITESVGCQMPSYKFPKTQTAELCTCSTEVTSNSTKSSSSLFAVLKCKLSASTDGSGGTVQCTVQPRSGILSLVLTCPKISQEELQAKACAWLLVLMWHSVDIKSALKRDSSAWSRLSAVISRVAVE